MADLFPRASVRDIDPKSCATDEYNCVAWAVQRKNQIIWPDELEQHGWAEDIDRNEDLAAFRRFFEASGYTSCADGTPENLYEKIAIYTDTGIVTHVARLQSDGKWTSKLGGGIDGEHPRPE